MTRKIRAAFFDRDGTIIKDVSYLSRLEDICILPGIVNFCLFLQSLGFKLFVITNQSGVARGLFDETFVQKTHKYLNDFFLRQGVVFEKFYYCIHHPTKAVKIKYLRYCFCRKPNPGMFFRAARDYNINLSSSLMFGDKLLDLQSGIAAGCKSFFIQEILCPSFDLKQFKEYYL
jgi:D-glycero-D-manno-heptose 1,7-bisphosphate phosphatase